jgi:glycerol kinase
MQHHLDEKVHYQLQGMLSFAGTAISKTDLLKDKISLKNQVRKF